MKFLLTFALCILAMAASAVTVSFQSFDTNTMIVDQPHNVVGVDTNKFPFNGTNILTNNYSPQAFLPNGNSSNAFYLSPRIDFSTPKIITMPGVPVTQNQGIALDKRNYDVYMNQNNSIYKFNAAGSLIASNVNVFQVFTNGAQWIMEDSDFFNGQLVVPTMLYTAGPSQGNVVSNLSFCVFDTNLNLIASYGQSNNMQSSSSLVDAPDLGILFALQEYDTTNLYEYSDVAPFTFIKKLAYGSPMKGNNDYVLQGIAYKFGNLYIQQNTGASGTMWQVDPLTGTNSLLANINNSSLGAQEDEGLDWNGTNLFLLVANPPNYLSFSPPQAVQVNRFGKTKMNFAHSLNFQNDGVMSSQIGYPDPSADGLIADYPFTIIEKSGAIYDNSSFAKRMTGSLFTQPFTGTGVSGLGATFLSGSQDMFVDQIPSDYSGLTNLTISAWIMPSNGVGNMDIVSKYNNVPNGEFLVDLTDNTLRFVTINTNQNRVDIAFTNAQVRDGKWHLVTATYSGSSTSGTANQLLYLDGGLVASGTNTLPLQTSPTSHFTIGAYGGGGGYWEGNMDEIKLYNRVLNTNEILNAYNQFSLDKKFSSVTGKGTGLSALNFSSHFGVTNVPSGLATYYTTNASGEQFVWYNQFYLTNGIGGGIGNIPNPLFTNVLSSAGNSGFVLSTNPASLSSILSLTNGDLFVGDATESVTLGPLPGTPLNACIWLNVAPSAVNNLNYALRSGGGNTFFNTAASSQFFFRVNNANIAVGSAALFSYQVPILAETNVAKFGTVTVSVALNTPFNAPGQRSALHLSGSFADSLGGQPILVVSNFTTGIAWTNTIAGGVSAALVPFTFDCPYWSSNDLGVVVDRSTGTGSSVSISGSKWITQ